MFNLLFSLALFVAVSPIQPTTTLADLKLPIDEPNKQSETLVNTELVNNQNNGPIKLDPKRLGVETNSKAVVVMDWESGQVLFSKNANESFSIASITKLMSALVVMNLGPDWDQEITILKKDDRVGDLPVLYPGDMVTVENLFNLSLVSSSNDATIALARSTGLSLEEFAQEMNRLADNIGLKGHNFVEPTGLDSENQATAFDVALLVKTALLDENIQDAVLSGLYEFETLEGVKHRVWNTDQLLNSFLTRDPYSFHGGKTGYVSKAGYCFGAAASDENGNRVVAVVLGANSKVERFTEVKRLLWWAFDAWSWEQ